MKALIRQVRSTYLLGAATTKGMSLGASYPDSVCIDGYLWDADSGDACDDGWCYTNGGEIPCPKCNTEAYAEYFREDDEYQKGEDMFNAKQAEIGGMPYGTYGGID